MSQVTDTVPAEAPASLFAGHDVPRDLIDLMRAGRLVLMVDDAHVDFLRQRHAQRPVSPAKADGADKRGPEAVARLPNAQQTGGYGYAVDAAGVARVSISGLITPEAYAWYDDAETITDWVTRDLAAMQNDAAVKAALFVINSPGGYVAGAFEMADAIEQFASTKPTATAATGYCCSAAYLQAAQTADITAYRTAIVGSIGTRSAVIDARELFARFGVKMIPVDSGGMKSAGLIGTEITPEQIQYFRSTVLKLQEIFTQEVADGRDVSIEQAQKWANGRVHVAADALEMGLIDAIGTTADAYQRLLVIVQSGKPAGKKAGAKLTGGPGIVLRAKEAAPAPAAHITEQINEGAGASAGPVAAEAEAPPPASNGPGASEDSLMANPTTTTAPASQQAAADTGPKPATIAELKAAFPTDPAYALEAAEKAFTLVEAKAGYADVLAKRLDASAKENEQLKASAAQKPAETKAEEPAAKKPGVKPVESKPAEGKSAGGASLDAKSEFTSRVSALVKDGKSRADAVSQVAREDPALHQQMIDQANRK